jgi:F0F1-type ATP synthase delta subunit
MLFDDILFKIEELIAASRGSVKVRIVSAQPLQTAQVKAVNSGIAKFLGKTKVT